MTSVCSNLYSGRRGWDQQVGIDDRIGMYRDVLRHWLLAEPSMPITLVDNSGDDLLWAERAAVGWDRSNRLALVRAQRPKQCTVHEIGCYEAHSVHTAVAQSRHFRPSATGKPCTHALMLTGRYAVFNLSAALHRCGPRWAVAFQNPKWRNTSAAQALRGGRGRQETSAYGFKTSLTDALFGWWRQGGACQECHASDNRRELESAISLGQLPAHAMCQLPPLDVKPVREGSNGIVRTSI